MSKITAILKTAEEITGIPGMISFRGNEFSYLESMNTIALKGERLEFKYTDLFGYNFKRIGSSPFWFVKKDWLKDIKEVPDIRPASELKDLPVDTKILVSNSLEGRFVPRHLKEIKEGRIRAWENGRTSWSIEMLGSYPWNFAKLPNLDIIYKSEGVE